MNKKEMTKKVFAAVGVMELVALIPAMIMNVIISFFFVREVYMDSYYFDFMGIDAGIVKTTMTDEFVIDEFMNTWGGCIATFLPILLIVAVIVAVITTVVVIKRNKKS